VERQVFSPDLLFNCSTALFLLRKNRGDKTPVELFLRFLLRNGVIESFVVTVAEHHPSISYARCWPKVNPPALLNIKTPIAVAQADFMYFSGVRPTCVGQRFSASE
jgi:hypothetical protein